MIQIINKTKISRSIPLFLNPVHAGFPSPAENYADKQLDLNDLVILNKDATIYLRCLNKFTEEGINKDDIVVVDRALSTYNGCLVLCFVEGEFTVKRYRIDENGVHLCALDGLSTINITNREDIFIEGVVTYVIHKLLL